MNNSLGNHSHTALVLGGGGSTGNAWLIGIVAGLLEAGLDVTDADLIIGTSAGATAAAQITGADPAELLAATLAPVVQQGTGPNRPGAPRGTAGAMSDHLERYRAIIATSKDVGDLRRRMGTAAIEKAAASDGSWPAQWRATVAARLPSQRWPDRKILITAVDATTGEPVLFDRDSGVELVDAVAASTSGGGLPYAIGVGSFIDGGYRSNADNADLAAGYERVLVLSPLGGRSLFPAEWGTHLATQVDELRASGSAVVTVFPDATSEHLFGANAMNPALRAPAARAGYEQAQALAEELTAFWR